MLLTSWLLSLRNRVARKWSKKAIQARHRQAARRLGASRIERLEDRALLAVNLVSVSPNVGAFLVDGAVRNEAPRELTFKFSAGQVIDPTSLGAIHITRSGSDGVFQPASVYSDFNTNGAAIIEFDALQLGDVHLCRLLPTHESLHALLNPLRHAFSEVWERPVRLPSEEPAHV